MSTNKDKIYYECYQGTYIESVLGVISEDDQNIHLCLVFV